MADDAIMQSQVWQYHLNDLIDFNLIWNTAAPNKSALFELETGSA